MSLVNVGELMTDDEFMEDVILRRPSLTRFANEGEPIASYENDVAIRASVQPATADDVLSLSEGDRGSGALKRVWSASELQMADGETRDADVIVWHDKSFRVVGQQDWDGNGYRFVLAKEFLP